MLIADADQPDLIEDNSVVKKIETICHVMKRSSPSP